MRFQPRSSDPVNPAEGDLFYSDGTARPEGLWVYTNSAWSEVGSSVSGNIQYFSNIDLERDLTGISTYDDGGAYVDGTGGSTSAVSISKNSASPLAGLSDLKISKAASSASGEGVTFLSTTLDKVDAGRKLWVSFEWDGTATNYVENDIKLYAYDVTNAQILPVIPLAGMSLDSTNNVPQLPKLRTKIVGYVATKSNTSTIRFSLHTLTDNAAASAYDVYIARPSLSPQSEIPGAIVTEPVNAGAITIGAVTTAPTKGTTAIDSVVWRRVGKYAHITYRYSQTATGANGSGDYLISLPAGLSVDTSLVPVYTGTIAANSSQSSIIGEGGSRDAGSHQHFEAVLYSATQFRVRRDVLFSVVDYWGSGAGGLGGQASYSFTLEVLVPISGWVASAALSTTEIGLQSVQVVAYKNAGTVNANGTIAVWTGVDVNTHNAFNATTGVFTAPKRGNYLVGFHSRTTTGTPVNHIRKNGSIVQLSVTSGGTLQYSSAVVPCNAGDTITFTLDTTLTLTSQNYETKIYIAEQPDFTVFSAILDTSDVELFLDTGNGHGSTNTRIRRYTSIRKNTLGQYATYSDSASLGMSVIINIPGVYQVMVNDESSAGGCNVGVSLNGSALSTSITGITYAQGYRGTQNAGAAGQECSHSVVLRLNAGDIVRCQTDGNPNGTAAQSCFQIIRVGA